MCSSDLKPAPKKTKGTVKAKKKVKKKPTSMPGDRKEPLITSSIKPIYPKTALNNNWEGKIQLEITVNNKGHVSGYKVIKSTGHQILDDAFIRTVKDYYKFKPRRVMGKDQEGKIRIKYTFSLGD